MMEIISRTKKNLAPALIDNRGLAEGGVDTGEERAVAHWRVATKEHLTLGGWAENICSDERKYLEIGSQGNANTSRNTEFNLTWACPPAEPREYDEDEVDQDDDEEEPPLENVEDEPLDAEEEDEDKDEDEETLLASAAASASSWAASLVDIKDVSKNYLEHQGISKASRLTWLGLPWSSYPLSIALSSPCPTGLSSEAQLYVTSRGEQTRAKMGQIMQGKRPLSPPFL